VGQFRPIAGGAAGLVVVPTHKKTEEGEEGSG
jgi:hypothetical protein